MADTATPFLSTFPSQREASLAKASARALADKLVERPEKVAFRLAQDEREVIELPFAAVRLLIDLLDEMSKGNAVSLIPMNAELTTQQAADLLNVSRGFLVKLLDNREIPHRMVGKHRRVLFNDLKAYEERTKRARMKALDKLTEDSQALGIGYE
ncbi:MAG: excisionase family DNA-binding protein [Nitrospinae bacterium]|nr:excisionase family DNA-binding protein [Nitrospinota bacterium]